MATRKVRRTTTPPKRGRQEAVEDSARNASGPADGRRRRWLAEYVYVNEDGTPNRLVRRTANKEFPQYSPNGKDGWKAGLNGQPPVPYRLPEVIAAVARGEPIWIVEGEKDVHAAEQQGVTATCNPGGAGKWTDELSKPLKGARVKIVWDRDPAGEAHAWKVARSLEGVAASVTFYRAQEGNDLTDHLAMGLGLDYLFEQEPPGEAEPPAERSPTPEPRDEGRRLYPAMYVAVRGLLNDRADGQHGKTLHRPRGPEQQYMAFCPAHDDRKESLSVRLGDKQAVALYCHAGCEPEAIVNALGLDWTEFGTPLAASGDDIEAEVEQELKRRERQELVAERLQERMFDRMVEEAGAAGEAVRRVLAAFTKSVGKELPRLLTDQDLLSLPPPPRLIEGWFVQRGYTPIYSPPGVGKTLLVQDLGDAIRRGEAWHGWKLARRGSVLVLAGEGVDVLGVRLQALITSRGKLNAAAQARYADESWDITTIDGLARLVKLVAEVEREADEPVAAVFIDPVGEYRITEDLEDNEPFARAARALGREMDLQVFVIAHTNAEEKRERGTGHLRQFSEAHLRLEQINSREVALIHEKHRAGPERAIRFELVETGKAVVLAATRGAADDPYTPEEYARDMADRRAEAKERNKTALVHNPDYQEKVRLALPIEGEGEGLSLSKAKRAVGGNSDNVGEALDLLVARGLVIRKAGASNAKLHWRRK